MVEHQTLNLEVEGSNPLLLRLTANIPRSPAEPGTRTSIQNSTKTWGNLTDTEKPDLHSFLVHFRFSQSNSTGN